MRRQCFRFSGFTINSSIIWMFSTYSDPSCDSQIFTFASAIWYENAIVCFCSRSVIAQEVVRMNELTKKSKRDLVIILFGFFFWIAVSNLVDLFYSPCTTNLFVPSVGLFWYYVSQSFDIRSKSVRSFLTRSIWNNSIANIFYLFH